MIRINNRVKVGLYSPSRFKQIVIPNKLLSNFVPGARHCSVDEGRIRNKTSDGLSIHKQKHNLKINSTPNKNKIEISISKFVNLSANKFNRDWIINERPDEMLKRYLRTKKKELKKQKEEKSKDFCSPLISDNSIITGCHDLTTQNTYTKTTFKSKELSEKSCGLKNSTITRVSWLKQN